MNREGSPSGFVLELSTANVFADVTWAAERSVTVTRPNLPGEPGRMNVKLWRDTPDDVIDVQDFAPIRLYDPYATNPTWPASTANPYVRYFNGFVINPRHTIENNAHEVWQLECVDWNWRWKNPPSRPLADFLIGAPPVWLPSHPYVVGDYIQPTLPGQHRYFCQVAGASTSVEPTWNTGAGSTTDELIEATRASNTNVDFGTIVRKASSNGHKYRCTTPGRTGGSEPPWNTGSGSTTTDGTVVWTEIGSDISVQWREDGSADVPDDDIINELLDIYYPGSIITKTGINRLIASVPSIQVTTDMSMDDCLRKIAEYATSTTYFADPSRWAAPGYTYEIGDEIVADNHVHGLIFQCRDYVVKTDPHTTGGSYPTDLDTIVDLGAMIIDGNIKWYAYRRFGKWSAATEYVAGQRIEPEDVAHLNGLYYEAMNTGVAGSPTAPVWPTTIGDTVTSGTITFKCMGATSVSPAWQFRMPSDNAAHTAVWTPDAWYFDANTDLVTSVVEYSDQYTEDSTHKHYASITINREGVDSFANRWYIRGRNNSFAQVDDLQSQSPTLGLGIIVSRTYSDTSDTGPSNETECAEIGRKLLTISRMRETVQVSSNTPLDPAMIQTAMSGAFTAALLGLSGEVYPLVSVSVTLGEGMPVWNIEGGAGFLTDRQDVYSNIRGGRHYAFDITPPGDVTWEEDTSDPNYWIAYNGIDRDTKGVTFVARWVSDRVVDLDHFVVRYRVQGDLFDTYRNVIYPAQELAVRGLPMYRTIQFWVLPVDSHGNYPKTGGLPRWSASPVGVTAPGLDLPHAPNITNPITGGVSESGGYYARPVVNKNNSNDDARGGGIIFYTAIDGNSDRPIRTFIIPAGSAFPYTAYIPNLGVGVTYSFVAVIIDAFGRQSADSSAVTYLVRPVKPNPVPDPPEWDNGHPDQLFAGWLPVSPAVDADFALDASVASFGGSQSLKAITPINTDKAIVSPLIKCHEGDVLLFRWAGKRGIGTGTVPNGLLKIQHYAQDGTTTVGSLTTLDTITGLPTVYPTKLRLAKQAAPSGSFGYKLTLVSSGQVGATSSYNVWFTPVKVWAQVSDPSFFKPLATSTDPWILPDADGDPAVSIYQTGDVSSDGGAQSLLAAGNLTIDVGNAGQANGDLHVGASGGMQLTTVNGTVIDGGLQIGGAGQLIMLHLNAVANLSYSTIKTLECEDQTVTVSGAQTGDTVVATPASDIGVRHTWCAWVSAADTVTIRVFTVSSGSGTPNQVDWSVDVWNH